jgi:hypothetical protein
MPWQACHGAVGPDGPVLSDCRPIQDFVDPQGRELWIRSTIAAPNGASGDTRPRALYVAGVASSEAWLNGQRLGANGRPGATARDEDPRALPGDLSDPRDRSGGPARTPWCCACRRSTAACASPAR